MEERRAARQPRLSSPDGARERERRGGREENEQRRERVELSGVLTGRGVCVCVFVWAHENVSVYLCVDCVLRLSVCLYT